MKATEIIEQFAKGFERWLKYSKQDKLYYQNNLSEKQTKWFFDVFNKEKNNLIYESSASGIVKINSRSLYYQITRIRDGIGVLRVEPLNFVAYYMQYMNFYQESFETYDAAFNRLYALFDDGDAMPLGIYDGCDRVLYVSDELNGYSENLERIQKEVEVTPDRVEKILF